MATGGGDYTSLSPLTTNGYVVTTGNTSWSNTATLNAAVTIQYPYYELGEKDRPVWVTMPEANYPKPTNKFFRVNQEAYDVKEPLDELRLSIAEWLAA